jgi:hypothetical protein
MRRFTSLIIPTAIAVALFAASLLPAQARGAAALDFWSWEGFTHAERGSAHNDTRPGKDADREGPWKDKNWEPRGHFRNR